MFNHLQIQELILNKNFVNLLEQVKNNQVSLQDLNGYYEYMENLDSLMTSKPPSQLEEQPKIGAREELTKSSLLTIAVYFEELDLTEEILKYEIDKKSLEEAFQLVAYFGTHTDSSGITLWDEETPLIRLKLIKMLLEYMQEHPSDKKYNLNDPLDFTALEVHASYVPNKSEEEIEVNEIVKLLINLDKDENQGNSCGINFCYAPSILKTLLAGANPEPEDVKKVLERRLKALNKLEYDDLKGPESLNEQITILKEYLENYKKVEETIIPSSRMSPRSTNEECKTSIGKQ